MHVDHVFLVTHIHSGLPLTHDSQVLWLKDWDCKNVVFGKKNKICHNT